MDRYPDFVSLILLTMIAGAGGLAAAFLLHSIHVPDALALLLGVGGMIGAAWWLWWDLEIKGH